MQKVASAARAFFIVLSLSACGPSQSSAPASDLAAALASAPSDASEVWYTHWALLKKYEGVESLTSQSSMDRRREFMLTLSKDQAGASGYAVTRFFRHAEAWGWDSTDLVWEITLTRESQPPAYVLRFRDDFDFAAILTHFDERGFTQSQYNGATIYSHEMDLKADWLRQTEFAILNTAVLAGDKVLALSTSIDSVKAILDARRDRGRSLAGDEAFSAAADRLGEVAAAALSRSAEVCADLAQSVFAPLPDSLKTLLDQLSPLQAYRALGIGYRYESEKPLGLLVLHYASAADAQADLEARKRLLEEGYSLRLRRTYSEALFKLDKASVEGSDIVLRVNPANDMPRRLIEMVFTRDLIFAACP